MFERFTDGARRTTVRAQERASLAGDAQIEPLHLIEAAAEADQYARAIMLRCGGDPDALAPSRNGAAQDLLPFTDEAKKALELGLRESLQMKHAGISGAHILLGALTVQTDGPAHDYLASRSISVDQLRTALAEIPDIVGASGTQRVQALESIMLSAGDAEKRNQAALKLVEAQIRELRVHDAVATAMTEARGETRAEWSRHMVVIAELVGDARSMVRHGQELLTFSEDPMPGVRGTLARAYALMGKSAEAWAELQHVPTGSGGLRSIWTIEAAETYLLLGETERSSQTLAEAGTLDNEIATTWHRLVQAQLGRAGVGQRLMRSQIESELAASGEGALQWIEYRLRAEALWAEVHDGSARTAARDAQTLADEARYGGLGGVLCDALEVKAMLASRKGGRRSRKAVAQAIAESERLGRFNQAERIRANSPD